MRAARAVAAAITGAQPTVPPATIRQARVTATNAGPPPTLDLLVEDTWPVPGVRYADHIDSPQADDKVWVVWFGPGRWFVLARTAE